MVACTADFFSANVLRCSVLWQNDNSLHLVLCHCHLVCSPSLWKSSQKVSKSVVCYSCVSVFVGPINREMRHLISSLQNHNHQLKGEVLRYKRKLREAQSDLSKVSEQKVLRRRNVVTFACNILLSDLACRMQCHLLCTLLLPLTKWLVFFCSCIVFHEKW